MIDTPSKRRFQERGQFCLRLEQRDEDFERGIVLTEQLEDDASEVGQSPIGGDFGFRSGQDIESCLPISTLKNGKNEGLKLAGIGGLQGGLPGEGGGFFLVADSEVKRTQPAEGFLTRVLLVETEEKGFGLVDLVRSFQEIGKLLLEVEIGRSESCGLGE